MDKDYYLSVKKIISFLSITLLISCVSKDKKLIIEKPINLIEKSKFIGIVSDVMMLESHIQKKISKPEKYAIPMKNSIDSLLKSKKVSFEEYNVSFDYYGVQEKEMKEIFESILDTLTNRKKALNK